MMDKNYDWATKLITWYHSCKRTLPWRDDPVPYKIWISEMMLQQTQVATVIPYFLRFIERFPTIQTLASSSEEEVLKAWEGLGYYTRARNLLKTAQVIVNELQGEIPNSFVKLQLLPGIGPYASAAIASIAFGEPVPAVDGNFLRVFARFWGVTKSISDAGVKKDVFSRLQSIIALHDPSAFNQSVMELGATVCKPKSPLCSECPLAGQCWALQYKKVGTIPHKIRPKKAPHIEVGAAIVWHKDKVLIIRRPEGKMLAGLWEFPGGKQEAKETIQETIIRELDEETALHIKLICELGVYRHAYSHFTLRLHAWHAKADDLGRLHIELPFKWVRVDELSNYPFPEVDRKIIRDLKKIDTSSIM